MIIAEEMDADWSKVRVEQLPFGIVRGADGAFTWKYGEQGAGGSTNIPDAWADLRHAGARVRQVLLAAAAQHWNVPVSDLHTEPGIVKHTDGRTHQLRRARAAGRNAAAADRATAAEGSEAVSNPRHAHTRRRHRRHRHRPRTLRSRLDDARRIDRSHHALPDLRWRAEILRRHRREEDPRRARRHRTARPEARRADHANLAPGVAVIADNTWAALQGQRALKIEWTPGPLRDTNLPPRSTRNARSSSKAPARACATTATSTPHAQPPRKSSKRPTACHSSRTLHSSRRTHASTCARTACSSSRRCRCPAARRESLRSSPASIGSKIEVRMTRVGGGFGRRLSQRLHRRSGDAVEAGRQTDQAHVDARRGHAPRLVPTVRPPSPDRDARRGRQLTGWTHRLASASKYYRRPDVKPEELWTSELYPDDFPAQLLEQRPHGMVRGQLRHHARLVARARAHRERIRRAKFRRRDRARHAAGSARACDCACSARRANCPTGSTADRRSIPAVSPTCCASPRNASAGAAACRAVAGSASPATSPSAVTPRTRWK